MRELAGMVGDDDWTTDQGPDLRMLDRYWSEAYSHAHDHGTWVTTEENLLLVPTRLPVDGLTDTQAYAVLGTPQADGRRPFETWIEMVIPVVPLVGAEVSTALSTLTCGLRWSSEHLLRPEALERLGASNKEDADGLLHSALDRMTSLTGPAANLHHQWYRGRIRAGARLVLDNGVITYAAFKNHGSHWNFATVLTPAMAWPHIRVVGAGPASHLAAADEATSHDQAPPLRTASL
jgi:hypothetical protein